MRGEPSSRITRVCFGSMRRNSRASVCCAISLIVPAISTPVGPPPMTTKVSQASRSAPTVARSALFERADDAGADLEGVGERLQPGRVALPFVVAEVAVRHAGGDDEMVPGDRLAAVERGGPRGDVDRSHLRLQDRQVAARHLAAQRVADRRAHRRRAQARGRDLVEERLEQVMVGAVDERDLDRRLRERPHRLDAAEAAADDEDARPRRRAHAALASAGAGSTSRSATMWMWVRSE